MDPTQPDQADFLRQLVRREPRSGPPPDAPKILAILGGKGGVGTTTVATNLAVALAELGNRLLLVDADFQGSDLAAFCQLQEDRGTLIDVLNGRYGVHEVLQPGPGGIQVLPGRWVPGDRASSSVESEDRLLQQLYSLGKHVETILIDLGSGLSPRSRRFVEASDGLLLVTTTDPVSVMDTYAAAKFLVLEDRPSWLGVCVNQSPDEREAEQVVQRLNLCCQRFLGRSLQAAGKISFDSSANRALRDRLPLVLSYRDAIAATQLEAMAQTLLEGWACQPRKSLSQERRTPPAASSSSTTARNREGAY
ncbi:CbiA domain-containing protein [Planctomycetales bacterium 10988]|nr:CbiA domain-containing protein [Planctomycetales bacterium 10988]